MKLIPAEPTEDDARLVMEWRNDPVTLSMSFHQQPKQWPDFLTEFQTQYFTHPDLPPLFGVVDDDVAVGFLRFRAYDDELPYAEACDIGVMVAPEERGKGYGHQLVMLGTFYIHEQDWPIVVAEILPHNEASIRLFKKADYQWLDAHDHHIPDLPEPVRVLRYIHRA